MSRVSRRALGSSNINPIPMYKVMPPTFLLSGIGPLPDASRTESLLRFQLLSMNLAGLTTNPC
jgi:hypothetical protein